MATATQFVLLGQKHSPIPDCSECEGLINGKTYESPDGETLCFYCFETAGFVVCPNCDDVLNSDDLAENPDGDKWCEDCATTDSFVCDNCDDRTWDNDCVTVEEGGYNRYGRRGSLSLCESCADNITFTCDDCGDRYHDDDSMRTRHGSSICQSCYEDGYITCEGCGNIVHQDDASYNDDGCYCSDCGCGENFDPAGFCNHSGCVTETGSARCYGIELETDECDGYNALEDTSAWGAKDDSTVSGKEFFSDILNGDEGLDAVREWGRLASANGWEAGRGAGYHLHIDMRKENNDSLFAIAYAYRKTQEVWLSFVEGRRHTGSYSHTIQWDCADIVQLAAEDRSFSSFACRSTRYNWCNLAAYSCHGTIEIRLHGGTCDDIEVINWVKVHTRFADWASNLGLEGVKEALDGLSYDDMFRLFIREIWRDYQLSEYYAKKARHHNHGFLLESINLESCSA